MFDEVRKCPFIFSDETDQSYDCVGYLIEKYKENIKPLGQGSSQLNKAPVGVGVRNYFFENGKMRIEAVVLGAGGVVDVKVANGSVFDVGDDVGQPRQPHGLYLRLAHGEAREGTLQRDVSGDVVGCHAAAEGVGCLVVEQVCALVQAVTHGGQVFGVVEGAVACRVVAARYIVRPE